MNAKKSKLSRSDLNAFFTNCLKQSLNFKQSPVIPTKALTPYQNGFNGAQHTISKRFGPSINLREKRESVSMPVPQTTTSRHGSKQVNPQQSPKLSDKATLVKPMTNRRNSYVCLTSHPEQQYSCKNPRYSVQYLNDQPSNHRSASRDRLSNNRRSVQIHPNLTITQRLSPIKMFTASKNSSILTRNRHFREESLKRQVEFAKCQQPLNSNSRVNRVQTKREFKTNFREFLEQVKSEKPKVNFENYIQRKTTILNHKKSGNISEERLNATQNKLAQIGALIDQISDVRREGKEAWNQKNFKRHHEVNFVNSNVGDLLRDVAKADILERMRKIQVHNGQTTGGALELAMKKGIIAENVRMMQEQIYFEEFLTVLAEKGVDVENMFSYCNDRLKIKKQSQKEVKTRMTTDPASLSLSEVSLIDYEKVRRDQGKAGPPRLRMDFTKVRKYSTSESEATDE